MIKMITIKIILIIIIMMVILQTSTTTTTTTTSNNNANVYFSLTIFYTFFIFLANTRTKQKRTSSFYLNDLLTIFITSEYKHCYNGKCIIIQKIICM